MKELTDFKVYQFWWYDDGDFLSAEIIKSPSGVCSVTILREGSFEDYFGASSLEYVADQLEEMSGGICNVPD